MSVICLLAACGQQSNADEARYVLYLHGQIVQDVGPRPTHPRWGLYDYPLILDTLAEADLTVISERRKHGTKPEEYARTVAKQVQKLLAEDVQPDSITVVGFSAGGYIAIMTSSMLPDVDINYVFLASCSDWMQHKPDIRLNGHVLSISEASDQAYSCKELAQRTPGPRSYEELTINTGKEHGAFYLPDQRWLKPVLDWISRRHPQH
jgi:dienelactone hydrolase